MSGTVSVRTGWRQTAFALVNLDAAEKVVGPRGRSLEAAGRLSVDIALTCAADRAIQGPRLPPHADDSSRTQGGMLQIGRGPSGRSARQGRTNTYTSGRHRLTNFGIVTWNRSRRCPGVMVADGAEVERDDAVGHHMDRQREHVTVLCVDRHRLDELVGWRSPFASISTLFVPWPARPSRKQTA